MNDFVQFPPGAEFAVTRTYPRHHRLSITALLVLHESNHICSLSNDSSAKVLDIGTGCVAP